MIRSSSCTIAVLAIESLVPEGQTAGRRPKQVNVLASAMLTPGDIEAIRDWIEAFGLRTVVVPDIGDSLDVSPGSNSGAFFLCGIQFRRVSQRKMRRQPFQ